MTRNRLFEEFKNFRLKVDKSQYIRSRSSENDNKDNNVKNMATLSMNIKCFTTQEKIEPRENTTQTALVLYKLCPKQARIIKSNLTTENVWFQHVLYRLSKKR